MRHATATATGQNATTAATALHPPSFYTQAFVFTQHCPAAAAAATTAATAAAVANT